MTANAKIPPKPGKDVVYVDIDDDITSIIDKVEAAKEKVVALVLPKRATVLQSIVNMRLLKRSSVTAGKNAVLITSEEALIPLAGAAGLHVARNLQSVPAVPEAPKVSQQPSRVAEIPVKEKKEVPVPVEAVDEEDLPGKIDYERPIGELATEHELEHPEVIELDDEEAEEIGPEVEAAAKGPKKPNDKKLKIPNYDKFRIILGLGILALIALIVFIVLAFTVLPKAVITIKTSSTPVAANFSLTTSDTAKSLDESKGIIPAAVKAADQPFSQTVQATGQQNNGQKASGSVVLVNCSTDNSNITVPAGTGISSSGMTFITQSTVSLPYSGHRPGGSCDNTPTVTSGSTDVVAQQGGAKYNLPSGTSFDVSGYPSVTATNSSDFSGGTDDIQTVVSQSDVDNAKGKITSADTDKFTQQFEKQLSDQGYYVLTSTLKLSDPAATPTPAVGQPASTVSVSIKITYTVLAIKKDDMKKALIDQLNQQIDQSKQKISDDNVLDNVSITVQNQTSPAVANLSISKSTTAVPIINVNKVKQQAVGQKSGDITASITNLPGVQDVNVKMSPFWVIKAPKASKIQVVLQQVKSSTNGN